jgi:hypothetical protein
MNIFGIMELVSVSIGLIFCYIGLGMAFTALAEHFGKCRMSDSELFYGWAFWPFFIFLLSCVVVIESGSWLIGQGSRIFKVGQLLCKIYGKIRPAWKE